MTEQPWFTESEERVKACLRACAGIPTEQLEAGCVSAAVELLADLKAALPHDPEVEQRIDTALAPFQKESDQ